MAKYVDSCSNAQHVDLCSYFTGDRGESRTAATSKMEHFVNPLTIITKSSILDVAAVLDPPLGEVADVMVFQKKPQIFEKNLFKRDVVQIFI